jgi:L-arabinokinase
MDQLTATHGEEGRLLRLLCQPAQVQGSTQVAPGLALFGIDSGVSRRVADAPYTRARVAAFMGLRVLAEALGAKVLSVGPGRIALEQDPLGGYLARLEPSRLSSGLLRLLPESISGGEFVTRYGGISDPETSITPELTYPVRAATLHPIEEHARSEELSRLIGGAASPGDLVRLAELMAASHASYSACGLGSASINTLVTELSQSGPAHGIYGAKISGGGSGGTVVVLAHADAATRLEQISSAFGARTGRRARLLSGSSPGIRQFPPRWLEF